MRTHLAWCVAGPTDDDSDSDVSINFLTTKSHFFSPTCDHNNIDPTDVLPNGDNIRSSEITLEKSVERLSQLEKHGFESDGRWTVRGWSAMEK